MSLPFVDEDTGAIDRTRVLSEAIPLTKLVTLVAAVALVPFIVAHLLGWHSILGELFTLVAQFVLAVGSGIVLIYVVARGEQLAEK